MATARRKRPARKATSAAPTEEAPKAVDGTVRGDVRWRILDTASRLFYAHGVRAVGVDLVVQQAGVAKTSLYRHFPTKDELVVAFLEGEDAQFWSTWDSVAAQHADAPRAELEAQLDWIAARLDRPRYRGCPQINVAAEFAGEDHPARQVAQRHMLELRRRFRHLAARLEAGAPDRLAAELALLVNGAFVSGALLAQGEAGPVLRQALLALLAGAGGRA